MSDNHNPKSIFDFIRNMMISSLLVAIGITSVKANQPISGYLTLLISFVLYCWLFIYTGNVIESTLKIMKPEGNETFGHKALRLFIDFMIGIFIFLLLFVFVIESSLLINHELNSLDALTKGIGL
tara:strand:+ start:67 stop:441 length:375 start_codon:yes stop_codon:yes gene_type:complete